MTAPDQWQAGKYELDATAWDQRTSKLGEPVEFKRHLRGDVITLNAEDARRLGAAGAIVKPGEREKAQAESLLAAAQAAQAAYDAKMAQMTPDPQESVAPKKV